MPKDLDVIYFINAEMSRAVIPIAFSLPIKFVFLRIFLTADEERMLKIFLRASGDMNVLTRQMTRRKETSKFFRRGIVSAYLAGTKSSYVSGRFLARIAAHHTPRKAFSFRMGQDRSTGRHRGEGEPRAFSGITLWRAADVHPCSCPYLLPLLSSPTPL